MISYEFDRTIFNAILPINIIFKLLPPLTSEDYIFKQH